MQHFRTPDAFRGNDVLYKASFEFFYLVCLNPRGIRLTLNYDTSQIPTVLGYETMWHVGITCMWMDVKNLDKDPEGTDHSSPDVDFLVHP